MDKILYPQQADYIGTFKKGNDPLIKEMERYAAENEVPILSWQSADLLELLIKMKKPKRVLEIGTAIGYSSIRIAKNLKRRGVVYTIEKSTDNIGKAKQFIARSGCDKKIEILEGEAVEIMSQMVKKYNFIFLDADKNDYVKLFELSLSLLKKGGILFVDNLLWHGYAAAEKIPPKYVNSTVYIKEFNRLFMSHPELKSTLLPVGDGIGLAVKL